VYVPAARKKKKGSPFLSGLGADMAPQSGKISDHASLVCCGTEDWHEGASVALRACVYSVIYG
jgi:hypothetical protein